MPDLTVTWKGAVPFEAAYGQSSQNGKGVVFDALAMAGGFDIRSANDGIQEQSYRGAVPYSSDEDFEWAAEFEAAQEEIEIPKRGRAKKDG
jgi:hypothetical protein